MTRRRIVVLSSAAALFGLLALIVLSLVVLTQTGYGRAKIRAFVVRLVNAKLHGTLFVGNVSALSVGDLAVDTLDLRDRNDSVFIAARDVHVHFDLRDLFDYRIALSTVHVGNVIVRIDFDSAGNANFRKIFPSGAPGLPRTTIGWGDYIALRNAEVDHFTVQVTQPWKPNPTLRGAALDSAIRYEMGLTDHIVRRRGSGYSEMLRWTDGRIGIDSARLDDRVASGRVFGVHGLDLVSYDPPFAFRNVRGVIRLSGDSLWVDLPHFDLPGSTGSAKGKVWWGDNVPTRFDLAVVGDSVSLADVAWVYPTLPKSGGGKMRLLMKSESDPRVVDYALSDLDVRTTDSWLRGRMTFGVGAPVLLVKDVDLVADPVDFKLIETLSGGPLPYPFKGTLSGTVKGRGGPLSQFVVDASNIVFRDANVPGAVNVARGAGELDITKPSETRFHDFSLDLDQLDLRSVQALNPGFPRLNGIIAGHAVLDSAIDDIRFRNADLTHSLGSLPVTHVTGAGRVTFGTETAYDVALNALPISFTTLNVAYVGGRVPLHGEYAGPMRLQGTMGDLDVSTDLRGPSGSVGFDGRVDADSAGGYGVHGGLRFGSLNLRTFLDTARTPATELTGTADVDVAGETTAALTGSASLNLERSLFDSVRIYPSHVRVRFADQRLYVAALDIETAIGSLTSPGGGALGLAAGVRDSVGFALSVDSLGGFRRYLRTTADSMVEVDTPVVDSLTAEITGSGWVSGSIDTVSVAGHVDGLGVSAGGARARSVHATADVHDVTHGRTGTATVSADTLSVAGIQLAHAGASVSLSDRTTGRFEADVASMNGPSVKTSGDLALAGDTTRFRLDTFDLAMREHRLTLDHPALIAIEPKRITIDTVRLTGAKGERIALAADLPASGTIQGMVRVDSLHLADVSDLTQLRVPLGGGLNGAVDVAGTADSPDIRLNARVSGGTVGQVNIARINVQGHYANEDLQAELRVLQQDTTVMDATLNEPIDITFARRPRRAVADSFHLAVRSNDVDLRLLESFTSKVSRAAGRFSANLDLAGPARSRRLVGTVSIAGGAASLADAGIQLRNVEANIVARNDSVIVSKLSMVSGDQSDDILNLTRGYMAHPLDSLRRVDFRLTAHNFHVIGSRRLADLSISTGLLALSGSASADTLTGGITVTSGSVYMPEEANKQLITLPPDLQGLDTAAVNRLGLLPHPPSAFLQNLTIQNVNIVMGPDVWVRTAESNDIDIKLGGSLQVTVNQVGQKPQLALDGALNTERGRYLLNLGSIVRRSFDIESGTLSYFDQSEVNDPVVNISALYTVRQVTSTYGGRNDVRIRARVTGTLQSPKVALESADQLSISESDLISYLVVGAPSFDIGGGLRQNYSQLSAIVLGSAVSYFASRASGGLFDYVEVQTAADRLRFGTSQDPGEGCTGALCGAQLGVGKQLNSKTFLSLSTGVCQFGRLSPSSSQRLDPIGLASSIGAKLEYQIRPSIGVSASVEPSLSALLCAQGQQLGFSTSVRQIGLDLFRTFRW